MKGNKTMNTYLITNNKDIRDHFEKDFENVSNAKDWIINHLDVSKQWSINQATKKAKKKLLPILEKYQRKKYYKTYKK